MEFLWNFTPPPSVGKFLFKLARNKKILKSKNFAKIKIFRIIKPRNLRVGNFELALISDYYALKKLKEQMLKAANGPSPTYNPLKSAKNQWCGHLFLVAVFYCGICRCACGENFVLIAFLIIWNWKKSKSQLVRNWD